LIKHSSKKKLKSNTKSTRIHPQPHILNKTGGKTPTWTSLAILRAARKSAKLKTDMMGKDLMLNCMGPPNLFQVC